MSNQLVSGQKKKSKTTSSFLKKTYDMLCEPTNETSIKWAKDGIGFIVLNEERFSQEVLPQYFKHSNYSSFVRQLNMYNFHKIREGNMQSYFHHELFDRNRRQSIFKGRQLLCDIKRKPQKKKQRRKYSEDEDQIYELKIKQKEQNFIIQEPLKKEDKKVFEKTRHAFKSEEENHHVSPQKAQEKISIRNILICGENDEDKISINNELSERIPKYPTKQIFYPSNQNLYPFSYPVKMSQFGIFL